MESQHDGVDPRQSSKGGSRASTSLPPYVSVEKVHQPEGSAATLGLVQGLQGEVAEQCGSWVLMNLQLPLAHL